MSKRVVSAVLLLAVVSGGLQAQGTLSGQGFGYPLGGLSTRAAASGGALAEFDARSSRNPAAMTGQRPGLYFQYDPEFRSVQNGELTDRTMTPRFASLGATFLYKSRTAIGVSSHSFLDRTWNTSVRSGQRLGADSVEFTERFSSSGAINDARLSVAHDISSKITIGAALHLYTGENRLDLRRVFDDSLRYGTLNRNLTLAYSGRGVSGGIVVRPTTRIWAAASARRGGEMRLRVLDTLRSTASVPDRVGAAVRVEALTGLHLMAGYDKTRWSGLNGLGTDVSKAEDGSELSLGLDFSGQATRVTSWVYSVGYRERDLPFAAAGQRVVEKSFAGGLSAPFGRGRTVLDVTLQRVLRDASVPVTERAWLLSFGFTVRP